MDNIRATIEILFKKQNPEKMLYKYYNSIKEKNVDRDLFIATYSYENPTKYNKDEIENVYSLLDSNWKKLEGVKEDSIFNVLANFTKGILIENKGVPLCKYKELLRWRELSYLLGEDLLTTAYFAYKDFTISYNRTIFAWKPIISTDNTMLKEIMKKGCAENHFHLKGSAPHFQLAWISLMNNIEGRDKEFKKIEKETRLSPDVNYGFENFSLELKALVKKASAIRLFLYKKFILKEKIEKVENFKMNYILKSKNNSEIKLFIRDLQNEINKLKYSNGKKLNGEIPDYIIPKKISLNNYNKDNMKYNGNILLYGERFFLYTIFKTFFEGDKEIIKYKRLIHTYILIKERFRDELIQINRRVGFGNFSDYQNRKNIFLGKGIYEKAVVSMAINSSLYDQHINYLEARIAPEKNNAELSKTIEKLDENIESEMFYDVKDFKNLNFENTSIKKEVKDKKKYFYVIHFIKKQEKYKEIMEMAKNTPIVLYVKPLNYQLRRLLKKQADAIINLRKSSGEAKNRIYGIDAANFEIGCRPEVFAQCFRYLRNYKITNKFEEFGKDEIFNLGITYHAGEDFLSLIDGLRAIDETIRFLGYEQGDRIGHALALGVDANKYYKDKNYTLIMPKQIYLDNIAWMLAKIRELNIEIDENLKSKLCSDYYRLVSEIYEKEYSYENYYRAWKLRGDDPNIYKDKDYKLKSSLTFWEKCSIDPRKEMIEIRKNEEIVEIYRKYHFNKNVKERGIKSEEIKINKKMGKIVTEIQYAIQKELANKNICIEANPSSNYVIGNFKRYDGHPITKFYNIGLNVSEEENQKSSQLSVSINTDDQGIFGTYLENEYALITLAMEKLLDENGERVNKPMMVYEWVDKIRALGLEQSFLRRNEK
ncbi:hypothetical protein [Haliovirga abyssi]|uniref:adenosine deaminase n=1 Tax=Haliovirga abyssi TaxID=2996794 RepID=A0AAU9D428_9FUSO|nr:hypothetical protein [Haliovirga abyssi]BDU50719.1 hypothetical protein HLVA_12880 [Haliovirga abyssi]